MGMFRRFQRLYPYLWRHRGALLVGILCLIVANYLEIMVAVMLGSGVDLIALRMGWLAGLQRGLLSVFLALLIAISLGFAALRFWMRRLIIDVSRHVEYRFRNDFFARLLGLPASFYVRFRTGDLISRATSDMEAIRVVIGPAVMYVANTLAILPMTLVQMLHISPRLTFWCWLPMVLIAPLFYFFSHRIHRRFRRVQEQLSEMSTSVQETLGGVRVVKVYAREDERAGRFDRISGQFVDENMRLAALQSFFFPSLTFLVGAAILMLLWGGSTLIIKGDLSIGALVTFFVLLMASIWPMAAFGWVLAQLERGAASMVRVEEILHKKFEIEDHAATLRPAPPIQGRIEFRNLTFTYPGAEKPALREIDLDLPPGTTLGLTGPVGCGKSTLAALLARRYNPPRGTLFIDGVDILDWPVEALRRRIGIVDQEPFLFSDTIEANIAFGLDAALPPEKLREIALRSARIAQLVEEIDGFPHGIETILGERGINLSGGQRQRVALARALARDPALLILDDSLAAVDTHTEEAILEGLRGVMRNRTTILISHRVSTVALADFILVMEDGRIVERGTHEELLTRRGRYFALARRQRLAEEIERTA